MYQLEICIGLVVVAAVCVVASYVWDYFERMGK